MICTVQYHTLRAPPSHKLTFLPGPQILCAHAYLPYPSTHPTINTHSTVLVHTRVHTKPGPGHYMTGSTNRFFPRRILRTMVCTSADCSNAWQVGGDGPRACV